MTENKLGNFVKIKTGRLDANASSSDGKYPFFTCSKEPLKISSYTYDCKCVLVAGNGDLNVKYYEGKFDAYQRTYIIESNDETILNTRYLYWFLSKHIEKLRKLSIGGVIKYIRIKNLTDQTIPLPTINNQKRIVKILDEADALRQKRKQAIELLDDYLKSIFLEMFGDPVTNSKKWESGEIGDLVSEVKYGTSAVASSIGDFPYLRMNNITYEGELDTSNLKYINLKDNEKKKYLVKKGDLLFNRTNSKELVGKTTVYNLDEPMAIAGYLIRVRTNKKAIPEYISGYLNFKHGKKTLENMCKSIIGMANINAKELQKIKIFIPPLNLQTQYKSILQKTFNLKQKMLTQSKELEVQFQALMQKAFSSRKSYAN